MANSSLLVPVGAVGGGQDPLGEVQDGFQRVVQDLRQFSFTELSTNHPGISAPTMHFANFTGNGSDLPDLPGGGGGYLETISGLLTEKDLVPPDLSPAIRTLFIVSYSLIMVLSIVGNLLVIVVVAGRRKMRTVTNTFLVSLAVSDLLIASLNMPLQLSFHLTHEWTLGEVMCKFTNYIQGVTIVASILTLTGIAADRYYAICHPLRARHVHTIRRALIILTLFWLLAFTLVSPQLVIQRLELLLKPQPGSSPPLKVVKVCQEYFKHFWLNASYSTFFYVVLYLLPVVVMFATHGKIAYTLWVRAPIGETPEGSRDRRLTEKKRVVRMLLVIMVLFAVSWFPFFTYHIYLLFHQHAATSGGGSFRVTMAVFQLFGYSNSCSNPIVYCFLNQSFRQNFLKSLCLGSRGRRRRGTYTSGFSMDNDRSIGKFETTGNSILTDPDSKFTKYEMTNRLNSSKL